MSRREAWLTALGIFVVARGRPRRGRGRHRRSRGPRTPPTTWASPATSPRAGAWSRDALWSYGTPPLVFPRPAFEVWLPLPSLLAADPDRRCSAARRPIPLLDALRAAQLVTVHPRRAAGGAGLAPGRGRGRGARACRPGRARTLAIGAGPDHRRLPAADPPLRRSRTPRSSSGCSPWARACSMTRVLRDPRGARLADPRLLGDRRCCWALAALTRNEAIWLALAWAWLAWRAPGSTARGAPPADRRGGRRGLVVFAPWAVRDWAVFGNPLPGPGGLERAVGHRLRHLRLATTRPPCRATSPSGRRALLEMRVDGHRPQPRVNVLLLLGIPRVGDRPAGAALAGPRPRAAAAGAGGRDHVPRHEPACSPWPPPGARSSTPRSRSTCC